MQGYLPKDILQNPEDLAVLTAFDRDGDGNLDAQEIADAQRLLMEFGDTNRDGVLDEDERKAGFERFKKHVRAHDENADGVLEGEELTSFNAWLSKSRLGWREEVRVRSARHSSRESARRAKALYGTQPS